MVLMTRGGKRVGSSFKWAHENNGLQVEAQPISNHPFLLIIQWVDQPQVTMWVNDQPDLSCLTHVTSARGCRYVAQSQPA